MTTYYVRFFVARSEPTHHLGGQGVFAIYKVRLHTVSVKYKQFFENINLLE